MVNIWIILFAIGFIIAIFFIIYFISKECINENSNLAEVLDELDQVCQEYNKKIKSSEIGPVKTDPIPQNILRAFKGISEE